MGLFGSSKKYTTANTTNVTTTTTTNIRDIGVTGNQAIDLERIIQQGSIERANIAGNVLSDLFQQTGAQWNKLVGGASGLVETAGKIAEEKAGVAKTNGLDLQKMMPFLMVGALGIVAVMAFKGAK